MVKKLVFVLLTMLLIVPVAGAAGGTFNYEMPPLSIRLRTMPLALSIMGPAMATQEQCVQYLLRRNPLPLLTVSPHQLVAYYYEEAVREGIRPDVAFAQALHETGNFGYGGDVVPLQNNYCGLGTTGGGVKGAWFETAQIGVRAQIQHLVAYTSTRRPVTDIVDPRYELVRRSGNFAQAVSWTDLNGRWAVPGTTYGQKIMTIHQRILAGE